MGNSQKYAVVTFDIGIHNSIKKLSRKNTILGLPTKISTSAANAMIILFSIPSFQKT